MNVVAMVSAKGGTGKTVLACALADLLAETGRGVVVVDADPQGVATRRFLREASGGLHVVAEAAVHGADLREAVRNSVHRVGDRVAVVPATGELLAWEDSVRCGGTAQVLLKTVLDELGAEGWQWVLVDTPGYVSAWFAAAASVADVCVMPLDPTYPGWVGAVETYGAWQNHREWGVTSSELVVVPNRVRRTNECAEVLELAKRKFLHAVFAPPVPFTAVAGEAYAGGLRLKWCLSADPRKRRFCEAVRGLLEVLVEVVRRRGVEEV